MHIEQLQACRISSWTRKATWFGGQDQELTFRSAGDDDSTLRYFRACGHLVKGINIVSPTHSGFTIWPEGFPAFHVDAGKVSLHFEDNLDGNPKLEFLYAGDGTKDKHRVLPAHIDEVQVTFRNRAHMEEFLTVATVRDRNETRAVHQQNQEDGVLLPFVAGAILGAAVATE